MGVRAVKEALMDIMACGHHCGCIAGADLRTSKMAVRIVVIAPDAYPQRRRGGHDVQLAGRKCGSRLAKADEHGGEAEGCVCSHEGALRKAGGEYSGLVIQLGFLSERINHARKVKQIGRSSCVETILWVTKAPVATERLRAHKRDASGHSIDGESATAELSCRAGPTVVHEENWCGSVG